MWEWTKAIIGGKCNVNWPCVARLDTLHLHKFAKAFRVHWLWKDWKDAQKLCSGLDTPCKKKKTSYSSRQRQTLTIGDGRKTSFWHSAWDGLQPMDMEPSLYGISKKHIRNLSDALQNNNWVCDLKFMHPNITARNFTEYITLRRIAHWVTLQPNHPNTVAWKVTANGEYMTRLAYISCSVPAFLGQLLIILTYYFGRFGLHQKCKSFGWLVLQISCGLQAS